MLGLTTRAFEHTVYALRLYLSEDLVYINTIMLLFYDSSVPDFS